MSSTRAPDPLREFSRYFTFRWITYFIYGSGPVIVIGLVLLTPNHPDILAWPGSLVWILPALLYPILYAGIRMDLRALRFWSALGTRLLRASYYRGGVTAVFDTNLVAEAPLGLRFSMFFDGNLGVLSPTPMNVGNWEFRSQHVLARASEAGGEGSIPPELRRIRETLGGRPPHGPLANQQLILTERPKPVHQWPEARYCIRLTLAVPRSQLTPQTLLNAIDDVSRFLAAAASTMVREGAGASATAPRSL